MFTSQKKRVKEGNIKGLFKKTVFYESPLSDKDISRIKSMVDLRETYQALIEIQRHPDYSRADFQELLGKLNRDYDRFVSQFGYLMPQSIGTYSIVTISILY